MKVPYNKLVRDKIPELIVEHGDTPIIDILDDEAYTFALHKKLREETKEYFDSYEVGELTDMAEVILSIAKNRGITNEEFEQMIVERRAKRGGFDKRILLLEVERR